MSTTNNKKNTIASKASLVSGGTAFSRILGLVREQVMAYFYGAGMATDAFLAAFRIPNLLRDMFAEGALSSAFIPVFKEKMVNRSDEDAFKLANIVIMAILIVVGLIVLLGIIAAPLIVYISAKGFTEIPGKFDLTVSLTQIMMVYLLIVSLSALIMGMLNSFGKFGIPAIAPALFNLGIILTVWLFYDFVKVEYQVYLLAIGVLIGGLGQLLVQLPPLLKLGFKFKPVFDLFDEGLRRVIKLLTPMIIGLSAGRINILINTLLASFLVEGSLSYLSYSYRLMHFPLGVFAVALGTVALPKVSEMAIRKDFDELNKTFEETISLNLAVIIPSAMMLAFLGREMVELIYTWGKFDTQDAINTSRALMHYSYGLVGFAAVRVTVPFFYAFSDSKLPMRASLVSVTLNILLYYPLIQILNFAGLAAATSVAGLVNFSILVYYLPQKGIKIDYGRIGLDLFKILVISFISIFGAKLIPNFYSGSSELILRMESLVVPLVAGSVAYIGLSVILKVKPIVEIFIKKR